MGDFSTKLLVLHHENLELLDIVNENFTESDWEHVFGGLGGSITDVGHNVHTLKLPSDSVVNTFWLPPVATELHVSITLMASKFLRPLFHNFRHFCWSNSQKVLTTESEGSLRVCTLCPTSVMDPPRPPNTCSQSDSVKFSFTISRSSRFS